MFGRSATLDTQAAKQCAMAWHGNGQGSGAFGFCFSCPPRSGDVTISIEFGEMADGGFHHELDSTVSVFPSTVYTGYGCFFAVGFSSFFEGDLRLPGAMEGYVHVYWRNVMYARRLLCICYFI